MSLTRGFRLSRWLCRWVVLALVMHVCTIMFAVWVGSVGRAQSIFVRCLEQRYFVMLDRFVSSLFFQVFPIKSERS
jgi:hypothetical protein